MSADTATRRAAGRGAVAEGRRAVRRPRRRTLPRGARRGPPRGL